ncbi:SWIM zinc finger family protein [Paenibacillus gansuensis]|uniref:SWIM zinc finger family protein n=1 Tax=Paenibacillus gansuensis TaxID=306542 RepID=A0ABW5PDE0_9BACL
MTGNALDLSLKQWIVHLIDDETVWQAGHSIAESEQVSDFRITPGLLSAKVRGGKPRPFQVQIRGFEWTLTEKNAVTELIWNDTELQLALLEHRLPQNSENIFKAGGVSLLPSSGNMDFSCSCSHRSIPCEHAAAALSAWSRRVTEDGWMLLSLRGVDRTDLWRQLRERRRLTMVSAALDSIEPSNHDAVDNQEEEGAPRDTTTLLSYAQSRPSFWNKDTGIRELLTPFYRHISNKAEQWQSANRKEKS